MRDAHGVPPRRAGDACLAVGRGWRRRGMVALEVPVPSGGPKQATALYPLPISLDAQVLGHRPFPALP